MADTEELSPEDILEQKIINRLQKTVKRDPSEKQKKHIESLAAKKKGSKYKKVETTIETEPTNLPKKKVIKKPVEEIEESEEEQEVIIVKKKKPVKVIYQSESEEELRTVAPEPKKTKAKPAAKPKPAAKLKAPVKKTVKKAPAKKPTEVVIDVVENKSRFNRMLM